jgi:hypothetical protein
VGEDGTQAAPPELAARELSELVERFRVCWELWPLRYPRDGEMIQVGFELDLVGTVTGDRGTLLPGDDRGFEVFEALSRIARWAISEVPDSVDTDFEVFDGAVHYSNRRKNRPDTTLKIEIKHHVDYASPLQPSEVQCVRTVIERLQSLGVQENQWVPPKEKPEA